MQADGPGLTLEKKPVPSIVKRGGVHRGREGLCLRSNLEHSVLAAAELANLLRGHGKMGLVGEMRGNGGKCGQMEENGGK